MRLLYLRRQWPSISWRTVDSQAQQHIPLECGMQDLAGNPSAVCVWPAAHQRGCVQRRA